MKKDQNKIIDEKASAILHERFAGADWQLYELKPDVAIDYIVEFVESGLHVGPKFAVQQKGQRRPRFTKDKTHILYQLETKYLEYYYDVEALPVFLVLVDVTIGACYWLFVQQYVRETLSHVQWRAQKSTTLRIPASNLVSTDAGVRKAVEEATVYMTELRPAAVDGAIRADQERWASLDPRFGIRLTATQDAKHYHLEPREPVSVTLTLTTPADQAPQKARDLFGRGIEVTLKPGEIVAKGSPLIEEITRRACAMRIGTSLNGSLVVKSEDRSSGVLTYRCSLPARATGGPDEIRLESGGTGMPLQLATTVTREGLHALHMSLSLAQWDEQPLSALPMFDQVHAILSALVAGEDLVTEFVFPPHAPAIGTLANEGFAAVSKELPVGYVLLLKKARIVSEFFGLDLVAPPGIMPKDQERLDILYSFATTGRHTQSGSGFVLSFKGGRTLVRNLVAALDEGSSREPLHFETYADFPLFGKIVHVQPFRITLTNAVVHDRQVLMAYLHADGEQCVEVSIKGGPDSELTYHFDKPNTRS